MSLARGALVQLQVVRALVLRETRTRFGAHQLGYAWALIEPLLWIATFAGMYAVGGRRAPNHMAVIPFLATGVLTYEMFSKTATKTADAINGNRPLLFYPQVQPLDLVLARCALETATFTAIFALVMAANALLQHDVPHIDDPGRLLLGLLGAALLGSSLGLVLCMLGVVYKTVERLRGPLMRPLFWASGIFYVLGDLPKRGQQLLLYNPVLHAVELVRDGWFHEYDAPHASPTYVLGWALGLSWFGLLLERVARRKIELT